MGPHDILDNRFYPNISSVLPYSPLNRKILCECVSFYTTIFKILKILKLSSPSITSLHKIKFIFLRVQFRNEFFYDWFPRFLLYRITSYKYFSVVEKKKFSNSSSDYKFLPSTSNSSNLILK